MAKGLNKVMLIGHLGQDPDVRYNQAGNAVALISLATTEVWTDKQAGQKQERTEWHRVVFFNRLAEVVGEYLKKGSQVYVEGQLRTRKYQDKNSGEDKYTTEINALEMQMLGGGGGSQAHPANAQAQANPQAARPQQQAARPQQQAARPSQAQAQPSQAYEGDGGFGAGGFDDDIPFARAGDGLL